MSNRSETFGRLLKGAINSIAAYEGKTAPAVEEDLGAQIGLAGSALQRYKAGNLPPDLRTVEVLATAAVRRAFLGRAWLQVFLQATRYPQPEALISRLLGDAPAPAPAGPALPSGTVTFLFTDIVGSTRLWEEQAGPMQRALARHDALLRQAIGEHGGQVFKTVGDAFCAAFATAPAAVGAALAIQRLVLFEPWSASGLTAPLLVRTVLHTGAAEEREGDYFGPPLNRVARLCGVGHGGQVLLSLASQELARDQLPAGVELRDLGEQRMKDLARPERIFQLVAPELPADFPPLKTLNAYRHNLPAQPTALIGREREVEDLTDLLRQPELRLLTLSGPGGTGKTRLAIQAAGELVEQFADGAWFVGLAPISDPALVASTIASAFGLREQGDRPIAELLGDYLREKQLLLLLDNFEQVLPAAALLADLLAIAPALKVLVTSRVVLHLYGEREYAVPPLSLPARIPPPTVERMTQYEAVRLFIERARAVRADFAVTAANAPQIAEICHRLDGLPLAIELAAARSKLFAPQAILARLDKRLAMLTGGAQNLPARQQTLRGAIDWSYDLLDAAERESFTRLGVFVGGFTLEAAEAVLAAGGDILVEPLVMLASLLDKSLLKQIEGPQGEPRFFMLETIREYALERLAASESAATTQRAHAEYFVALAEAGEQGLHSADELLWLDRLSAEHGNLRAALGWCEAQGEEQRLARLVGSLASFWELRGHWREGLEWAERCMLKPDNLATLLQARVIYTAGRLTSSLSNFVQAKALLERSLQIFAAEGNQTGCSDCLMELGWVAFTQSDYLLAAERYRASLSYGSKLGDVYRQVEVADQLACIYHITGRSTEAQGVVEQALRLSQALERTSPTAHLLTTVGHIAVAQLDYARAVAVIEESLSIFEALNDKYGVSSALNWLGLVAVAQHNPQQAIDFYRRSLAIRKELGERRGSAVTYGILAGALVQAGEISQARSCAAESLRISSEIGNLQVQIWGLDAMADALVTEYPNKAVRLIGAIQRLRQEAGIPIWPEDQAFQERMVAIAHAALSDEDYAAAWAAGRALGLDAAVAEALAAAG